MTPEEEAALAQRRDAVDPRDARIMELERRIAVEELDREAAVAALEEIRPVQELALELAHDPEMVELFNQAKSGREAFRRTQIKEIPESLRPLAEDIKDVKTFVTDLRGREKTAAEAAEREKLATAKAWQDSAQSFILETAKATPGFLTGKKYANGEDELTDDGLMMVQGVAAYANRHSLSFADAYKRVGDRFKPGPASKVPPSSLPADAGDPGILNEETRPVEGQTVDFADELVRRMEAKS